MCRLCFFLVIFVALLAPHATADPRSLDTFTSFEPPDTGPVFGMGSATAQFTGGSALTTGIEDLYHSGDFSWQTPAGVTTVVQFNTPASVVELFALDTETPDASIVAFGQNNQIISQVNLTGSFSSPMNDFSNPLQFTGTISRLEVRNPGGGPVWTDDFGFSVIPEPSCLALLVVTTPVVGAARSKRPARSRIG
jgi:hypothetical protein